MARASAQRPGAAPPKAERVELIASLMARGEYRTYLTALVLRERWGLAIGTITADIHEAARLLRIGPEQREAYQVESQAWFGAVAHRALTDRSKVTGLPDYRSAVLAREAAARYAGVRVDDDQPNQLPGASLGEAELLRRVSEVVERLKSASAPSAPAPEPGGATRKDGDER